MASEEESATLQGKFRGNPNAELVAKFNAVMEENFRGLDKRFDQTNDRLEVLEQQHSAGQAVV